MFQKIISCALSPNTEGDDVWLAFRTMLAPWKWKSGEVTGAVESWLKNYLHVPTAATFNSGRSALLAILTAFDIGEGDEVLIQAFTCVAVPNSVLWVGAKPIFVDIDDSLNIDPNQIEKHITGKTKAIVVQHTFGTPAQMDKITSIARRHGLILIEDCAHSLGATYQGKKVGSLSDAAFFSFGRDKVISSVWGGAAIISSKYKVLNAKLKQFQENLPTPNNFWIFQQLLHPIAFSIILRLYDVVIGKIILVLLQKFKLLSLPVYSTEKTGGKPSGFPAKFPNALAILAFHQLQKLDRLNEQRKTVVKLYSQKLKKNGVMPGAIYLRFSHFVDNPDLLTKKARRSGVLLGNWYHNNIDPAGVDFSAIGYRKGSCPKAEEAAKHIINLPTRISLSEANRVLDWL